MNILILSVGTRNFVVRCLKETLRGYGIVIAADCDSYAPALYEADSHYIIPSLDCPGYFSAVTTICRKERISGVLSLIDPELSVLAAHREAFAALGTTVVGSTLALCEMALDKRKMHSWLTRHGYGCAQSWMDKETFFHAAEAGNVSFPVLMKPALGSASTGVFQAGSRDAAALLFTERDDWIVQEYLAGQEIGADVYADMISGEVVSVFTKKKLRMRAGETDKSVSFKDPGLFTLIERFVTEAGFRGPVDIDLFAADSQYYISEVNPRLGGGYPHAHECGCDFTRLIRNNLNGIVNEKRIGDYEDGVYMMKYSDVMIRPETALAKP